jgi:hypothetical protein
MWGSFSEELLNQFKHDYTERNQTQKDCEPGERVVFGRCAKGDNIGDKKIDEIQKKAREPGAEGVSNDKGPLIVKGRKMGWAIKDGKPVLVDYGSVAGEKKVGPKPPKPSQSPRPKNVQPPAPAQSAAALANPNASGSARQQAINQIGRKTLENT